MKVGPSTILKYNAGSGTSSPARVLMNNNASRMAPTDAMTDTPQATARVVRSLMRELDGVRDALTSPLLGAVIVQSIPFVGGTSQYISHALGRAPQGWMCTRALTAAWAGFELPLETGRDATRDIRLQTATTGTFDVMFF